MRAHYCCCDIYLGSVIDVSNGNGAHTLSDDTKEYWEAHFVPSSSSRRDPNRSPTEVAPSTPVPQEEEAPSVPEPPRFNPDHRGTPPEEPAIGIVTKLEAKDGITQTPPLLSRLIRGHLEHTSISSFVFGAWAT